ncbi:nucleoside triphosphate pyrophosphohydrolase family protein [Cellulosimicrobium sp. Marseille-Q4280]|uniref:nucleoside triphosphate pyrophosphohydrolase family protein n=1 Tax=Cellulosimicrobium sp. Marseille-Q4280 TaxID=2937992 RepID=UPI0020414E9F|nr:nucleoside triphosphate pyrophosphohydrolase family protein [Cellulosimicrobium sp. Marseille-Q4280]
MTSTAIAPTGVSPHPSRELTRYDGESDLMRSVRSFHVAVGHPVAGGPAGLGPDVIAPERLELRLNLMAEEFCEVIGSIMGPVAEAAMRAAWATTMAAWDGTFTPDIAKVAKELSDLAYVLAGTALETAIPLDAGVAEVHASNMTKLDANGNALKRADGKALKSELYVEADMTAVLASHVAPGPYAPEAIRAFWATMPGRAIDERDGIRVLAADLRLAADRHDIRFAYEVADADPARRGEQMSMAARMLHLPSSPDRDDVDNPWTQVAHLEPGPDALARLRDLTADAVYANDGLAAEIRRENSPHVIARAWRAATIAAEHPDEDPIVLAARVLGAHIIDAPAAADVNPEETAA